MSSKYSNDLTELRVFKAATTYGKKTYTKETLERFQANWLDDLEKLVEQTCTNTIKAAVEALPKPPAEPVTTGSYAHGQRDTIITAKSNLKALIGGDK